MTDTIQNEVGIIFVINEPLTPGDIAPTDEQFDEAFKTFIYSTFDFSGYNPSGKVSFGYITSFPNTADPKDSPNTWLFTLQFNGSAYQICGRKNVGAVNLGNKDVLSSLLIAVAERLYAKRFVLIFHNHSSNFGMYQPVADSSSNANIIRAASFMAASALNFNVSQLPVITNLSPDPNKAEGKIQQFVSDNIKNKGLDFKSKVSEDGSSASKDTREVKALFKETLKQIDPVIFIGEANYQLLETAGRDAPKIATSVFEAYVRHIDEIAISTPEVTSKERLQNYKPDMLTNSELELVLQRAFGNKIDIIFNAGCYTQNIDLAYSIRCHTTFLVGAQSTMPRPGFDYKAIVNDIIGAVNAGSYNTEKIRAVASMATEKFPDKYAEITAADIQQGLQNTSVFTLDCSVMDDLAALFDELLLLLMSSPLNICKVKHIHSNVSLPEISSLCEHAGGLQIYDLQILLGLIKGEIGDELIAQVAQKVAAKLQSGLLSTYHGSIAQSSHLHGMSLYFPVDFELANRSYNLNAFYSATSQIESLYARDSLWREFLYLVFKSGRIAAILGS